LVLADLGGLSVSLWKTRLAWIAILLWLAAGLVLFADRGRQRVVDDSRISSASSVAEKRALAWGPGFDAVLPPFEAALDSASRRGFDRVLLVAPQPHNVFESLAWHLLFPAAIEVVPATGGVAAWREEAVERHLDAVVCPQSPTSWQVIDLRRGSAREGR
jgi:hypothetical protein